MAMVFSPSVMKALATEKKFFSLLRVVISFFFAAKSTKRISFTSCSLWPSWFQLEAIDNVEISVMTTLRLLVVVTRLLLYAMIKIGNSFHLSYWKIICKH